MGLSGGCISWGWCPSRSGQAVGQCVIPALGSCLPACPLDHCSSSCSPHRSVGCMARLQGMPTSCLQQPLSRGTEWAQRGHGAFDSCECSLGQRLCGGIRPANECVAPADLCGLETLGSEPWLVLDAGSGWQQQVVIVRCLLHNLLLAGTVYLSCKIQAVQNQAPSPHTRWH